MSRSNRLPQWVRVLGGMWLLLVAGMSAVFIVRILIRFFTSANLGTVLVVTLVLSLGVGFYSHRSSGDRLLSRLPVTCPSRNQAPSLHATLDRLAERMAVGRPTLYLSRTNSPTAFVIGDNALVIDQSLLRLLSPAEIEGVIAHEFAHLEQSHGLVRTLIESVLRVLTSLLLFGLVPLVVVVSMIAWGLALVVGRPVHGPDSVAVGLRRGLRRFAFLLFAGPTLAIRAYARRQEHAADQRAVEVLDNPLALASALETIQRANEPRETIFSLLFPARKREPTPLERALATHPPTDERIERVRRAARSRRNQSTGTTTTIDIE